MPRSVTGIYTLPEAAFVAGTTILSASVNSDLSDIASALTDSLAVTGVSLMTGPFKAATGAVTAPSITFASATGSGFYLSGTNEFSWTAAGILAGTFKADKTVTWVGVHTFSAGISVTSLTTVLIGSSATTPLTARNTTNDASEHLLISLELGSGAGNVGAIFAVGTGANDVSTVRFKVASTTVLDITATAFSPKKNISLDAGIIVISTAGYQQFLQIVSTASAAASSNKIYFKTDGIGYYNDANGVESPVTPVGAIVGRDYNEYTSNASVASTIPNDDSIPQVGEGTQICVISNYTMKKSTNRIRLTFTGYVGSSASNDSIIVALFSSLSANALNAATISTNGSSNSTMGAFSCVVEFAPASAAAITYSSRIGTEAGGAITLNGVSGARKFGGAAKATLVLEEINM